MKKVSLVALCLAAGILVTSCKKGANEGASFDNRSTSATDYSASSLPVTTVSGDITTNTTWDAGHVWEISGVVTVRNGATLTINAGTFIKSTVNTPNVQNGVLVISKGAKINAVGTATSPIVFTSRNLLDGNDATTAKPGEFGGVILLGNAKINVTGGDKLIEGLADDPKFHYGGANDADNSGTLQFVRIEFAGYVLAPNVEVNSLTLGGVGSGTTIDHVQASYGLDDGFEFFGGTVSPKYLISFANDDDQFDFDNGFTGTIQFAIAVADAYSTHSPNATSPSDSNGIESDNNAPAEDGTFTLSPRTRPTLSNFSVIGTSAATLTPAIKAPGFKWAFRNRRGAGAIVNNSLFTGYPSGIVADVDADASLVTLNNVSTHGFSAATSVLGTGAFNIIGTLNTSTAAAADKWGMSQPFYNSGAVNFATGLGVTRGAVTAASASAWNISAWSKFTF